MPLNTAGSLTVPPHDPMTGPSSGGADPFPGTPALGNPLSGIASGNDPLETAIQSEINASSPKTVSVMAPTKFGSLLKVLTPILEGGAIGAFSGKGHPGGGFGAAQDFYTARRAYQLQMAQFQRQSALTQSQIDERGRGNGIAQGRAGRGSWGQPSQAQDADGNPVFVVRNR